MPTMARQRRGLFRSIYVALIDDPDFQKLSPEARLMFLVLRVILGRYGIDVIRARVPQLSEATGLRPDQIEPTLKTLETEGWVVVDGNVIWIVNALKYEPSLSPKTNANHLKSVLSHLAGLPKLPVVRAYRDYYGLPSDEDGEGTPAKPKKPRTGPVADDQALVQNVVELTGLEPSDWGKQRAIAKRMLKKKPLDYWLRCAEAMPHRFPYSAGTSWDLFALEKHGALALADYEAAPKPTTQQYAEPLI